jgi:1-acyl-sn-glycerol-3-phosphate acyltransferase
MVATLTPRSDRTAIEAQVLAIARDLLRELGNEDAIEALRGSANLEGNLGLGSIERVELLSRLERSLGVSLPEKAVAEAKTLEDIVATIAGTPAGREAEATEQVPADFQSDAHLNVGMPESRQAHLNTRTQEIDRTAGIYDRGRSFGRVLETIYGIYAAAVFLIWLLITWLLVLLMPRARPAARMTSAALRLYFALIGCRIQIEGREHLGAYGACVYVSNHTSYSDVPVVMALFPTDYRFVAKSEINDMLFIGTFLRKLGHFAFERSKLRARSRQAEQMEKTLLQGESVFVFAEGTFTAQPGVRPFQLGAFRAAVKTGRPIIPVALRGTRRFLSDGTFLPKPSRMAVTICPALFPAPKAAGREWAEVLRLRDETRRIISSHSGEPLVAG